MLPRLDQQQVDVDRARGVARGGGVAPQLELDVLASGQQGVGIEVGVDRGAGVQEVVLADRPRLRLGLVDVGGACDGDAAPFERVAGRSNVREPVADVGAEAEVRPQSPRSFQTSTVTSSTGSGIGGSGFVARTVTASAP